VCLIGKYHSNDDDVVVVAVDAAGVSKHGSMIYINKRKEFLLFSFKNFNNTIYYSVVCIYMHVCSLLLLLLLLLVVTVGIFITFSNSDLSDALKSMLKGDWGKWNSRINTGACAQTNSEVDPWWLIELQQAAYITVISLQTPQACNNCSKGFYLSDVR